MKDLTKLYSELENRSDFRIIEKNFDGGFGIFTAGTMKKMTVLWSYGGGWEHVSIDGKKRCPDWDEMCKVKDMFFEDDEYCVQYHPAKKDYVNNIPYCLHIWKPIEERVGKLLIPPSIFTGIKGLKLR